MMADQLLTLRAGRLELALCPAVGGSIARLDWLGDSARVAVLRGVQGTLRSVLDAASFPLVPFCNRIRNGRFSFRDKEITLSVNMPGDPSPLHGQGWLAPWRVEQGGEADAVLVFEHPAAEWPWTYRAEQIFQLSGAALDVELNCTNQSNSPMPCGLGQHPYFPCGAETRLDTEVETAWTIDAQVLPVEEVPARGRYDLRDRPVCGQDLDNGFGGWSGKASITAPDLPFATIMSSPDSGFFQLYSPKSGGLFVAEPVTHANAALNSPEVDWPRLGMRVLEPGETMRLRMRIAVEPVG